MAELTRRELLIGRGALIAAANISGAEVVNAVSDRVRAELLRRIGLSDVLTPRGDLAGRVAKHGLAARCEDRRENKWRMIADRLMDRSFARVS